MQTTRLCVSFVLNTACMCSPCRPMKPSEAIAAVASRFSQSAKFGSVQARATTLAPFLGPTLVS